MSDHDTLREAIKAARYRITCVNAGNGGHYCCPSIHDLERLADAAESTLPKTNTLQVWHLEWATKLDGETTPQISVHQSEADARKWHEALLNGPPGFAWCIRVTGPHPQEVPA